MRMSGDRKRFPRNEFVPTVEHFHQILQEYRNSIVKALQLHRGPGLCAAPQLAVEPHRKGICGKLLLPRGCEHLQRSLHSVGSYVDPLRLLRMAEDYVSELVGEDEGEHSQLGVARQHRRFWITLH